jgi:hypothetical protein
MVERFSLEHQARNYAALYGDLINERGSGSRIYVHRDSSVEEFGGKTWTDAFGTHVTKIYDQLLYRSLKEHAIEISQQLKAIEADRAARLDAIHNLEALLQESEVEQVARLEIINEQRRSIDALQQEIKAIKSSLIWRMATVLRLTGKRMGDVTKL